MSGRPEAISIAMSVPGRVTLVPFCRGVVEGWKGVTLQWQLIRTQY